MGYGWDTPDGTVDVGTDGSQTFTSWEDFESNTNYWGSMGNETEPGWDTSGADTNDVAALNNDQVSALNENESSNYWGSMGNETEPGWNTSDAPSVNNYGSSETRTQVGASSNEEGFIGRTLRGVLGVLEDGYNSTFGSKNERNRDFAWGALGQIGLLLMKGGSAQQDSRANRINANANAQRAQTDRDRFDWEKQRTAQQADVNAQAFKNANRPGLIGFQPITNIVPVQNRFGG